MQDSVPENYFCCHSLGITLESGATEAVRIYTGQRHTIVWTYWTQSHVRCSEQVTTMWLIWLTILMWHDAGVQIQCQTANAVYGAAGYYKKNRLNGFDKALQHSNLGHHLVATICNHESATTESTHTPDHLIEWLLPLVNSKCRLVTTLQHVIGAIF